MQYLFVLGRDPELSKIEIESFLETKNINFKIIDSGKSVLLLDSDKLDKNIINELGGVIKIAEVISNSGRVGDIEEGLEKADIYSGKSNKIVYYISAFNTNLLSFVEDYLKDYFKTMKLKAVYRKNGSPSKLINKNILNNGVDLVIYKNVIGKTIAITNPKELKLRDISRPKVDYKKVISLRLAKILINISKVKKGETLLDPFCGSGSILQEALVKGINVIGIDSEDESVKQAEENIKWLVKSNEIKNKFRIIRLDCRKVAEKIPENSIDGIATEPYMGPYIRKLPSMPEAKALAGELTALYSGLLGGLNRVVKREKRVVIIIPRLRTRENRSVFIDFGSVSERNGFNVVYKPIVYGEGKNKLVREIYVLEKREQGL